MIIVVLPIFLGIGLGIARECGASGRELVAIAVGFVVAAAVPPALMVYGSPLNGDRAMSSIEGFLVVYLFALSFVVVLGVPAFLLLRPFRPGHWWSVAAAGGLLGICASALFRLSWPGPSDFMMGYLGGLTTLVFWLIWAIGGGVDMEPRRCAARRAKPSGANSHP
ncbi:hypothetical protein [Dongia sp.]|uniref:hypothetical protein n=1 Tax=Dongia sp. TaxID=1977262 RepID=UPI0037525288